MLSCMRAVIFLYGAGGVSGSHGSGMFRSTLHICIRNGLLRSAFYMVESDIFEFSGNFEVAVV